MSTSPRELTEDQIMILRDMTNTRRYEDGWACAQWIAESTGHAYDTPWATAKLPGLLKRGLIERGIRGFYRITEAGKAALLSQSSGSGR